MLNNNPWLESIQKNVSELIAKSPAADIERNLKSFTSQAFNKLELVTREEFDVQADLLRQAVAKLEQLETQLHAAEQRIAALNK
ncbi:MAG: accessory factor UbiK family protein [Burkholderiaceae bacterium]|nr:accessory factor UbiK family protein [Burkholderiaceae bacterium]